MKRHEKRFREIINRAFAPFLQVPQQQVDSACEHVLHRLQDEIETGSQEDPAVFVAVEPIAKPRWMRLARVSLAAAVCVAVFFSAALLRRYIDAHDNRAVVSEGLVYRISGEKAEAVQQDQRIEIGQNVRSNDNGAVLMLSDKSRIEMRSQSELSLERAPDGMRIRLNKGGVIVNAAKQHAGHLYVQTRDVTVSVVGTVFLVNAEEEGSRVAVIEGEVRVQQGTIEKNLRPGEHVLSNPKMDPLPVIDEIGWSKNAEVHLALLQQSIVPPANPSETFDVISIRPTVHASGGGERGAGGGGNRGSLRPREEPCGDPSGNSGWANFFLQIDPQRFEANDVTVHSLIAWAYHMECKIFRGADSLIGGSAWTKTDGFDIQAVIPAGTPNYTKTQFLDGDAPKLQKMVQAMLADRFKLVLRHEVKGMPVYILSAVKGGPKLTPWKEGDPVTQKELFDFLAKNEKLASKDQLAFMGVSAAEFSERWARQAIELPTLPLGLGMIRGARASMADLAKSIQDAMAGGRGASTNAVVRPVVDRTGLTGTYNYYLQFRSQNPLPYPDEFFRTEAQRDFVRNNAGGSALSLSAALEKELGLKLEEGTAPVEMWVIDRVERPTEN